MCIEFIITLSVYINSVCSFQEETVGMAGMDFQVEQQAWVDHQVEVMDFLGHET